MGNAAWVVTDARFEKAEMVYAGPNCRRLKMIEGKRAGKELLCRHPGCRMAIFIPLFMRDEPLIFGDSTDDLSVSAIPLISPNLSSRGINSSSRTIHVSAAYDACDRWHPYGRSSVSLWADIVDATLCPTLGGIPPDVPSGGPQRNESFIPATLTTSRSTRLARAPPRPTPLDTFLLPPSAKDRRGRYPYAPLLTFFRQFS